MLLLGLGGDLNPPVLNSGCDSELSILLFFRQLDPLFKRSSISSAYTGCKAMTFR